MAQNLSISSTLNCGGSDCFSIDKEMEEEESFTFDLNFPPSHCWKRTSAGNCSIKKFYEFAISKTTMTHCVLRMTNWKYKSVACMPAYIRAFNWISILCTYFDSIIIISRCIVHNRIQFQQRAIEMLPLLFLVKLKLTLGCVILYCKSEK
jgi:hypothetical protein